MGLPFLSVVLTGLIASCQSPQTSDPQSIQAAVPSPPQPDRLYVFGDSLSDSGNVFRVTEGTYPPTPPYFQGRYSNGPVWVEQLATKLGLSAEQTKNFAYGGATTANARENGIPGVLVQVQNFVKSNPQADPKALYVVWGGANDYLGGATNPTRVVENITTAIESLSKTGAKRFLVANLPDLGSFPATRNTSTAESLNSLSQTHNATLSRSLQTLNQKLGNETQIFTLDVGRLYQDAIAAPNKFGLKNVTNSCLNNAACTQPSEFLFWDGIHPTTKTHQLLAETAFSTLQKPSQVSANP